MRLARFGFAGRERWGVLDGDDAIRLAPVETEIAGALRQKLIAKETSSWEVARFSDASLLAPIAAPPQFIGVGLNYRDHVAEVGGEPPSRPVTFGLLRNAIVGPGVHIEIPPFSSEIDWEAELAIVIGKGGSDIPKSRALDAIAGYTIVNDVSARDIQMAEGQWGRAKSFNTFKPMGPWIAGTDEIGDASGLAISLSVNGVTKQESNTSNLVFDVPSLVSHLSQQTNLMPGMVIATGTPGGVGLGRTPPEYLKDGDVVEIVIEGIGSLLNPVRHAYPPTAAG